MWCCLEPKQQGETFRLRRCFSVTMTSDYPMFESALTLHISVLDNKKVKKGQRIDRLIDSPVNIMTYLKAINEIQILC